MTAILWLLLAWMAGWRWLNALLGDPAALLSRPSPSPWPPVLLRLAASLWAGLLPLTWLTYLLAWPASVLLPDSIHPLLPVNILMMAVLFFILFWPYVRKALSGRNVGDIKSGRPVWARYEREHSRSWQTLIRSLQSPTSLVYLLPIVLWLLLGLLMMFATFYRDGTVYRAGYTVFSDFAPHTALVSSFSQGQNWPTQYPHFANDGIAYHFMFFFLCGNLNYLGLPLDLAINIPSLLGLLTFCILLGLLAVQLTGRAAASWLAPLMLFCRSSLAFFTYLSDLTSQYGTALSSWPPIISAMFHQQTYIGNTPNDSWGLWGVNVYANQRHLLPGLSVALIILFLFLPDLRDGLKRHPSWRRCLFSREFWQIRGSGGGRRLIVALILGVLMPYFHGSVLVALLMILAVMAIFSTNRLAHLCFGIAVTASAVLQSGVFAGDAARVVSPSLLFGFIAENKSLPGILAYLLEMSGIVLPLAIVSFWLRGRQRKVLLAAFMLPLVFAFTVSLTPDVTVNHKFIMICLAFCNIYVADLLLRLWSPTPDFSGKPAVRSRKILGRVAAIVLAFMLMITGAEEIVILNNVSKLSVGIDSASPLVTWIKANTAPNAVFVTAPYHYNAFYLSGRSTWLGHAYYAWSAGHDTAGRLSKEQWLIAGCDGDIEAARTMISADGLDYLIIDETLREHEEFFVNEAFFQEWFPVAAEFPELGNMVVYQLQ